MLENAYNAAIKFAESHYENFPVLSFTLPKEARKHVAVVYQFARLADDMADEGNIPSEQRINNLNSFEQSLTKCLFSETENDFWLALKNTIQVCNLSQKYFYDLLSAFKQDVTKIRYNNFEELLDYCSRSANPVGRIVLEICNVKNENASQYSDSICTALQLTNFYQDVSVDLQKGRIYLPLDEMEKFGVKENLFEEKQNNANFKKLLMHQIDRTKAMFTEGKKLIPLLPKSLLFQIKMTILGGEKILQKIEEIDYQVLLQRPKLSKADYLIIVTKGLLSRAG